MTTGDENPDWLNVSRETFDKLKSLCDLVRRWNPAINLISKSTVPDIWTRHVLDSAQIFDFCPNGAKAWVDIGSGAGFPGLVVAIIAAEAQPNLCVTLVESDRRKAVFLSEAIRQLGLNAATICCRIDDAKPQGADVLSARALSPLSNLCGYAHRHLDPYGSAVFLKGANAAEEIAAAQLDWRFDIARHASRTSPDAAVLVLKDIQHV